MDFVFPWVFPLCHPGFPLLDVEHGSGYKEKAPKSSWKGRRRIWDGGNAVCPSASEGDPEEKYGFMERFGLTSAIRLGKKKIQGIVGSAGMIPGIPGMFEFTSGQELKALS